METILVSNPGASSLGGGGRYDQMIGQFSGTDLPAVGYSVGLDRTIEAMEDAGIIVAPKTQSLVLVTIFSADLLPSSLAVTKLLREANIPSEIYMDQDAKLEKQLKYADFKGIPFAIVIGPDEISSGNIVVKDLVERSQERVRIEEFIKKLSS